MNCEFTLDELRCLMDALAEYNPPDRQWESKWLALAKLALAAKAMEGGVADGRRS